LSKQRGSPHGAAILAGQVGVQAVQVKAAFAVLGKLLLAYKLLEANVEAFERLYDQVTVPGTDLLLLEVKKVPAGLSIIRGPILVHTIATGGREVSVEMRNTGDVPLYNIEPSLRFYALRGEWGDNTGTGLSSSVVEAFEVDDSATALSTITFGCSEDFAAGYLASQLSPGCTVEFSKPYTFDSSKYHSFPIPFQYQPGEYSWTLIVRFEYDTSEGRDFAFTREHTGAFELGYPIGTGPTTPTSIECDSVGDELIVTWPAVNDYDISEYRIYFRASAKSWELESTLASPATLEVLPIPTETIEVGVVAYAPDRGESAKATVVYTPGSTENTHPADTNEDWRLSIDEITSYGAAWKRGDTWPVPPNPIPIDYVTNAGMLWKSGETYHYVSGETPPQCWQIGGS